MRRQTYYPSRITDQIPWLQNFLTKLPGYETTLSLPSAHVDACVASCNFVIYVLEDWLPAVRTFGPAATSAMDLLLSGSGPDPVVLPVFTVPALPTGVASVPPGALNRMFDLIQVIKNSSGYTDIIGQDLDIVGPESPTSPPSTPAPTTKFEVVQGTANQAVKITFVKHGHQGVHIESERGSNPMEFLAVDTESPYLDDRPLLVPGTPEVRKYRLRFWDKGTPNGDWSDIATVTVGPE